jgi:hypothetical protein
MCGQPQFMLVVFLEDGNQGMLVGMERRGLA